METPLTRILVCDSNYLVREGLKSLLQNGVGFSIAAEAKSPDAALELLHQGLTADVLLMEIQQDQDAEQLIRIIKRDHPSIRIIALSAEGSQAPMLKAFKAGVDGYLLKSVNSDELLFGVKQVANNATYVCSALMKHFLTKLTIIHEAATIDKAQVPNFTGREIEILTLISQGYTNDQISEMLFTSRRTIENYRQGLIDKTGSRNIVSLVRFALLNGLIS